MSLTKRTVKRLPRGRGERANLTAKQIVEAAMATLEEGGLEKFSGRDVAKKLRVSNAAIYGHIEGGLGGLKRRIVSHVLSGVARPYRPKESPASYLRDVVYRLLIATRGKQALAQLIGGELTSDYLVCPQFSERLFSIIEENKSKKVSVDRFDLAVAMVVGMIMVEAAAFPDLEANKQGAGFIRRLKALPVDEAMSLLSHGTELMLQIKRRRLAQDIYLQKAADRYARPLIALIGPGKAT
jgi:AcrR family transcriptional regulator